MMRFFMLGNPTKPGVREEAERLLPRLRALGEVVVFDLDRQSDLSQEAADLALVLGGDGAILRAARQMGYHQVPILGINLGKLGFLADLQVGDVDACLPRLARREFRVSSHLMFECLVDDGVSAVTHLGLNEVVLETGPPFHMVEFELGIDGETALHASGDGLIISTPIGSTAHGLAAGGPILGQELQAFAVTPVAPHTLTARPLVDAADKVYTIQLRKASGAWLVIDGQVQIPLSLKHRVTIRRAPVQFLLARMPESSYFRILRDKLNWGTSPNYRDEPRLDSPRTGD